MWVVSGEDGGGGHWAAHRGEHPAARPRAAAEHHGGRQVSSGWPRPGHVTSDLTADWLQMAGVCPECGGGAGAEQQTGGGHNMTYEG